MDKGKTFKSFGEMSPQGRGNPPGRPSGRGGGGAPPQGLPDGYLAHGFLDDKGNLRREIFIEWPESITQSLRSTRPPASKNSLRAFYSMLRMAKTQFDAQQRNLEKATADAKVQLYKLRTAAQYQQTRNVISSLCQKFLNKNIDTVLEKGEVADQFAKNFNAFVEHFQAVIAYLPEKAER
jgi:CRISPR type III-A-associated protein Csm2